LRTKDVEGKKKSDGRDFPGKLSEKKDNGGREGKTSKLRGTWEKSFEGRNVPVIWGKWGGLVSVGFGEKERSKKKYTNLTIVKVERGKEKTQEGK